MFLCVLSNTDQAPVEAHFQNTQGLIFVVDSNDREHVVEARDELHWMLNEVALQGVKMSAHKTVIKNHI
jgi:hypothetical protein